VTIGTDRTEPAALLSAAEAILDELQSDDFVECYRMYYPRLVRAMSLAGADASRSEDLAQEAFARTLAHWRRVRRGANPAGYAYRTAFHLLARPLAKTSVLTTDADAGRSEPGPEGLATTRLAVEQRIAAMPPRRRACAVACLVVGLSVADTARAMRIAEGTVRKHLEEARTDLGDCLRG
jgi:DNA-directed RNA polymerase specialized sigma24 family protein